MERSYGITCVLERPEALAEDLNTARIIAKAREDLQILYGVSCPEIEIDAHGNNDVFVAIRSLTMIEARATKLSLSSLFSEYTVRDIEIERGLGIESTEVHIPHWDLTIEFVSEDTTIAKIEAEDATKIIREDFPSIALSTEIDPEGFSISIEKIPAKEKDEFETLLLKLAESEQEGGLVSEIVEVEWKPHTGNNGGEGKRKGPTDRSPFGGAGSPTPTYPTVVA